MKRRVVFTVRVVGGVHCMEDADCAVSGETMKRWRRLTGAPGRGHYRVTASLSVRGALRISHSFFGRLVRAGDDSFFPHIYTCWAPRSWHGKRINIRIRRLPARRTT